MSAARLFAEFMFWLCAALIVGGAVGFLAAVVLS